VQGIQVYLSLGGNQGDVLSRLRHACQLLSSHAAINRFKVSHFYRTAPLEMQHSAQWFVNAACYFETMLSPKQLFQLTQEIEIQLGKIPKPKTADRPIDIDLLFYGTRLYRDDQLDIPHPRWKQRLFVLIPLLDLTSEIILDDSTGPVRYVLDQLIQPLLLENVH
jgi:2-amino-4-hydroxy-6-hydroxymethyldihydropteridine diphosphokinase